MPDYHDLTFVSSTSRSSVEVEIQKSCQTREESWGRWFLYSPPASYQTSMSHIAELQTLVLSAPGRSVCRCSLHAILGSLSKATNTEPFVQNIIRARSCPLIV